MEKKRDIRALWKAWGQREAASYQAFVDALPASSRKASWEMARAIKRLDPRSPLLGLDDKERATPAEQIELRQRALAREDASLARGLAEEMMAFSSAPWRRWSCASPIADALFESLDELGHKEPYLERRASASLQFLMGFAGAPVESWIGGVARACSPEAFMASDAVEWLDPLKGLPQEAPQAFPAVSVPGLSEEYAKVWAAQREAERSPYHAFLWAALGFEATWAPERDASALALKPAMALPWASMGVSCERLAMPAGLDQLWPLARALMEGDERRSFQRAGDAPLEDVSDRWIELGASAQDIARGFAVWEWAVCARAEMGVGVYSPVDDELMERLSNAGADFSSTRLELTLLERRAPRRESAQPAGSLARYFELALDEPGRAAQAIAISAPWVARSQAQAEALALAQSVKRPSSSRGANHGPRI